MHADRTQTLELARTNAADVILTGHTHDLFIDFDGRTVAVESSYDAHCVTAIDLNLEIRQQGNQREIAWWPQYRVIDTATVTPDPEVGAVVAGFERLLNTELTCRSAPPRSNSTPVSPRCAGPRPRSAISSPTRCGARPRRRRDHERRWHPRRQGLSGGHAGDAP